MAKYSKPLLGLTVIYSTRQFNREYVHHLIASSGIHNKIQVLPVVNPDGRGLAQVYNQAAQEAIYDHIVFMHDDIVMETPGWGKRLLAHFENTDYDIIGLAGVRNELPASGCWWEKRSNMVGIVNHEHLGRKHTSAYSAEQGANVEPVIVVDGLFVAVNWKTITHRWDETIPGFHFYDLGFCFPNYLEGHNIGVITNLRVTHKSVGMTNSQWEANRLQFVKKYQDELPCAQE